MRDTAGASSSSTTQPRRSSRIRPTSAPRTTSPAASAERLDQLVDTYGDVVADRTDFVDWLSLRVGQLPVHVALPGDVRARVVARCDHASAHSTRSPSRSCGMWSDASMPISSSAPSTLPCTAVPGALPADRAACGSPARVRNSRSAITERPLFATQTKSTFTTLGGKRAADRESLADGARGLDRPAGGRDDVLDDRETE